MAVRRERIDRRLSAAAPIVLDQPADTIVVFRDGWGEVVKRYDLGSLGSGMRGVSFGGTQPVRTTETDEGPAGARGDHDEEEVKA